MQLDVSKGSLDLNLLKLENKNDNSSYSKMANSMECRTDTIRSVDKNIETLDFQQTLDIEHLKTFPKIIFLGTVSARASPIRGNTSILVHAT